MVFVQVMERGGHLLFPAAEQGDYAALRSHLEALEAYADALKDDGAALYEILRSYID